MPKSSISTKTVKLTCPISYCQWHYHSVFSTDRSFQIINMHVEAEHSWQTSSATVSSIQSLYLLGLMLELVKRVGTHLCCAGSSFMRILVAGLRCNLFNLSSVLPEICITCFLNLIPTSEAATRTSS